VRHNSRNTLLFSLMVFAAMSSFLGCGSGSSGSTGPTSITSAQSVAAANQVQQTFIAAVDQMTSTVCPLPPCCNINQENLCTMAVAEESACSGGGTATFNGSLSGDMNFYGTGTTTGAITFGPSSCSIPGSNLMMNGASTLTFNGQVFFYYANPGGVDITATGTVPYGPQPSGVCQVNLTLSSSIAADSNHTLTNCTFSGTACGETINENCDSP